MPLLPLNRSMCSFCSLAFWAFVSSASRRSFSIVLSFRGGFDAAPSSCPAFLSLAWRFASRASRLSRSFFSSGSSSSLSLSLSLDVSRFPLEGGLTAPHFISSFLLPDPPHMASSFVSDSFARWASFSAWRFWIRSSRLSLSSAGAPWGLSLLDLLSFFFSLSFLSSLVSFTSLGLAALVSAAGGLLGVSAKKSSSPSVPPRSMRSITTGAAPFFEEEDTEGFFSFFDAFTGGGASSSLLLSSSSSSLSSFSSFIDRPAFWALVVCDALRGEGTTTTALPPSSFGAGLFFAAENTGAGLCLGSFASFGAGLCLASRGSLGGVYFESLPSRTQFLPSLTVPSREIFMRATGARSRCEQRVASADLLHLWQNHSPSGTSARRGRAHCRCHPTSHPSHSTML
mmetsp:Transcript_41548/g.98490  ORF Transcript_41548/g.98490 Transcript_41548/m.98490 type:complete len:399 (-) Transcript_41548:2339-3535(-)